MGESFTEGRFSSGGLGAVTALLNSFEGGVVLAAGHFGRGGRRERVTFLDP